MEESTMAYDATARCAVLTFPNGKKLAISNVDEEQAKRFHEKNGGEFQKRDCCMTTVGHVMTREGNDG